MSVLDKIAATIMPPESAEDRQRARAHARSLAAENEWLAQVLSHHELIESAFAEAKSAQDAAAATQAVKKLGALLTDHSIAEEVVLYPALVMHDHKANAMLAYNEQQMAKIQMAELEALPPLSEEWNDKLEHIQGAVAHHMYEEEGTWFPKLVAEAGPDDRVRMAERYAEEWNRSQRVPA